MSNTCLFFYSLCDRLDLFSCIALLRSYPSLQQLNIQEMKRKKLAKLKIIRRVPTTSHFDQDHATQGRPIKIIKTQLPSVQYPSHLQVCLHQSETIEYEGNKEFYLLPIEEVLNYKGKLKLSVPQMEIAINSFPDLVARHLQTIYKANLWLYCGKRITKWHYDGHDNFLYVIKGKKTIFLAGPNSIISKSTFSLFSNHAEEGQKIRRQRVTKSIIREGECIYIPKGWWHYVISEGNINVAVNYWGNSISTFLSELSQIEKEILLKQLMFQRAQKEMEKRVRNWKEEEEDVKQRLRRLYFLQEIEQNKL